MFGISFAEPTHQAAFATTASSLTVEQARAIVALLFYSDIQDAPTTSNSTSILLRVACE